MVLTLDDLTLMISKLKEHNATEIDLDIGIADDFAVSVDFDIWNGDTFEETVLTVMRER